MLRLICLLFVHHLIIVPRFDMALSVLLCIFLVEHSSCDENRGTEKDQIEIVLVNVVILVQL